MYGIQTHRDQPIDDDVAIGRVELNAVTGTSGLFRGDQCGSAAAERVEHDAAAVRAIQDGVGDQRNRLHSGVRSEVLHSILTEAVGARISPDVRPVAPVLAKLDVVDVGGRTVLEDEHAFVLRTVERAHSAIRLHPDAHVFHFAISASGDHHLTKVSPVHANVVNRTIRAVRDQQVKDGGQEARELGRGHFPGRHGELSMLGLS